MGELQTGRGARGQNHAAICCTPSGPLDSEAAALYLSAVEMRSISVPGRGKGEGQGGGVSGGNGPVLLRECGATKKCRLGFLCAGLLQLTNHCKQG